MDFVLRETTSTSSDVQEVVLKLMKLGYREVPWKSSKQLVIGEFMRTQTGSQNSFELVDRVRLVWLERYK